jgi:hypothetical protein
MAHYHNVSVTSKYVVNDPIRRGGNLLIYLLGFNFI